MITIKDIAKAAGVSPASVSRVINNGPKVGSKTRERIKTIMQEMGYQPNVHAQALNTQQNEAIGIVLADLTDPFFAAMAHGIEQVASRKNVQIFMNSGAFKQHTEMKAIETLREHRYTNMVVNSAALSDDQLIKFAESIPGFVLLNRYIEKIKSRCVWLDEYMCGHMMAQHIGEKGHKQMAVLLTDEIRPNTQERLRGMVDYFTAQDITLPDTNIEYSYASYEGGEIAVQNLLAKGINFTALLCYNDAMAVGAISMFKAHGLRVPEDISVIGCDNLILAKCSIPKLTTINVPIEQMAKKAAELSLKLAKPRLEQNIIEEQKFTPSLVERGTVKDIT
ncbi:LacI family DNA-binding transcriptional regulator [Catenovulum adriaticum]|uniref:LacI family transcriptional regulator n=1 Tax=Catenovulum adriaticum TaxID=2984846 RepID=A0ABY7AU65_9ALTE|nr:LacI family DNA-binding transcriptional regulator [Catenovulum sp. TS8]WAJ71816.1 LacI family transcriptional regulator [Catenovulum sp. TS8]